jgi:nitroreductase
MRAQHRRNFDFFDAPVGLIITIDSDLPVGSWLDCGMFLQNIMVAARGFGLDTCPQQAFAAYHATIREVLNLPEERTVICAIALGVADIMDPANGFSTEREPLDQFARFHD